MSCENCECKGKDINEAFEKYKELIRCKSEQTYQIMLEEKKLIDLKQVLAKNRCEVMLNANFKELGLTNQEMRKAYVDEATLEDKTNVEIQKNDIEYMYNQLEITMDKMDFYECLINHVG